MKNFSFSTFVNFLPNAIASFLLFAVFFIAVQFVFFSVMPRSYFFDYSSVKPTKANFAIGEELRFVSSLNFKRPVDVVWNDNLRCPVLNGGDFFSQSILEAENVETEKEFLVDGFKTEGWLYGGAAPERNDTCFLRSTITANLPFGIKKTQVIIGENFTIGNGFGAGTHQSHGDR